MAAKSKQGQKKPNFAQHSKKITVIEVSLFDHPQFSTRSDIFEIETLSSFH